LTSPAALSTRLFNRGPIRRFARWVNAMPHPACVVEIAPNRIAAARWGKTAGQLDTFAVEPLPLGAVIPSPVEVNVLQPETVKAALQHVFRRVPHHGAPVAMLIPDPVVRVFILPFDTLPRRADEAIPLLRWRLKKSVPFDVDETVISSMRQQGRDSKLELVAAIARQKILREYQDCMASAGTAAAVVLSSTLASLPLIEDQGATLVVRMSGKTLTTVIVRCTNLCVYRSSEMAPDLAPRAMLEEIYPAIAFHQDTWGESIDRARFAGFGSHEPVFSQELSEELKVPVGGFEDTLAAVQLGSGAKDLIRQDMDGLVGWMLNAGA
jgi:type IV pilus assembly protein PilM